MSNSTALLLIAHGSRQAEANADLLGLADLMRSRGEYAFVAAAFLELAEPSIMTAGRECAERGVDRIVMAPYFLSPGNHVRHDLANFRATLTLEFPATEFLLAEPLGGHPLLVEIVAQRARQVEGRDSC